MIKNQRVGLASGTPYGGLSTLQSNWGSSVHSSAYPYSSSVTGVAGGTVSPWNIPFVKPEEKKEAPAAIFERWLKTKPVVTK